MLFRSSAEPHRIVDGFEPKTALGGDGYLFRVDTLFDRINDCKGDLFAISSGDGFFTLIRRAELALNTASHSGYYARELKDMPLVAYNYYYQN